MSSHSHCVVPEPPGPSHSHHDHARASAHDELPSADTPVYMGLPHERYLRPKFYLATSLTLPVLVLAMGEMLWPHAFHWLPAGVSGWAQLALTTPVFFWAGAPFLHRWVKSVRERDPNMFTLTVTGTGAAYFYSLAALVFGAHFPEELRGGPGHSVRSAATSSPNSTRPCGESNHAS